MSRVASRVEGALYGNRSLGFGLASRYDGYTLESLSASSSNNKRGIREPDLNILYLLRAKAVRRLQDGRGTPLLRRRVVVVRGAGGSTQVARATSGQNLGKANDVSPLKATEEKKIGGWV